MPRMSYVTLVILPAAKSRFLLLLLLLVTFVLYCIIYAACAES